MYIQQNMHATATSVLRPTQPPMPSETDNE